LSVCALLNGNMLEVIATLQTGLATPEHQHFLQ
jgi:hypothetical protein